MEQSIWDFISYLSMYTAYIVGQTHLATIDQALSNFPPFDLILFVSLFLLYRSGTYGQNNAFVFYTVVF